MKRLISSILLFISFNSSAATEKLQESCVNWVSILKPFCQRIHQIWNEGDNDVYLSGYAWHNRYTYSPEKIRSYNEAAWGGGLGKGLFDEKGNWQGLFAVAFLDSHTKLEPTAGYAYLKVANLNKDLKAGLGYSLLITARSDINNYIPFPGVLPWASLFYKKAAIAATYIPGTSTNGNVLYILGKYSF